MSTAITLVIIYRWGEISRAIAGAGGRIGSPAGRSNCRDWRCSVGGQGGNLNDPHRLYRRRGPVRLGLVGSLARPGGNLTGINFVSAELVAKRLELLRELLPVVTHVTVLVNPTFFLTESTVRDVKSAARAIGFQIQILNASTSHDIDAIFATFARERPDALFVGNDPFFTSPRVQLAILAARHLLPMTSATREIAEVGGLMSYGGYIADAWRQVGIYTGRILKGTKVGDLPVVQSSKFELVINTQTARTLGLTIPPSLIARADEVIESNGSSCFREGMA